jgi:hypothetical protein
MIQRLYRPNPSEVAPVKIQIQLAFPVKRPKVIKKILQPVLPPSKYSGPQSLRHFPWINYTPPILRVDLDDRRRMLVAGTETSPILSCTLLEIKKKTHGYRVNRTFWATVRPFLASTCLAFSFPGSRLSSSSLPNRD